MNYQGQIGFGFDVVNVMDTFVELASDFTVRLPIAASTNKLKTDGNHSTKFGS